MTDLIVTCGHEQHTFPLATDGNWTKGPSTWSPSDTGADVRCFSRQTGPHSWGFRLRTSNDSVVLGHPEKTKPLVLCDVTVTTSDGPKVTMERPLPDAYPMGRGAWRQGWVGPTKPAISFRADWRAHSSKYGPCNLPLPRWGDQQRSAMLSRDASSLRAITTCLTVQTPFHVEDSQDGVFMYWRGFAPHGPSEVGQVAGSGIYFMTGSRQSKPDLQRAFILAQCEGDRARFWVERATGEPISTEHYPQTPTPDTWGNATIPEVLPVLPFGGGDPLPLPYDFAHCIRGFRRTAQVAEQADDPMCAFMIHALAQEQRLRFSHRGRLAGPGYSPGNLTALTAYANPPNKGIFGSECGRQIGWPFYLVAYDAKLNGWVGEMMSWALYALAFLDKAVTPTGPIQKVMDGSGWPSNGKFKCQTFEQVILSYGATGLSKQSGSPRPMFVDRVLESLYGPNTMMPILGSAAFRGPDHYPRSADDAGNPVERLKEGTAGYGDSTHAEAACALMASLDPNPKTWVERGALYGTSGFESSKAKLDWLTSLAAPDNIQWVDSWIAAAQNVTSIEP